MTRHICALAVACAIVGAGALASAQTPSSGTTDDPAASARFHLGVLHFTPALQINNVGVDNNVFNSAGDPKADTTAAVGPVVNLWLKTGPARLSAVAGGQYLYFKTYGNQRAWNTADTLRWELTRGRLRPFVTGAFSNTKDRPGFEIDSRVRQKQQVWTAGANLSIGGRSTLLLEGGQTHLNYDQSQQNFGVNVAQTLDRRTDLQRAQFRSVLTPLTTWVVSAETLQDRFDAERTRNSDSVRVSTGFDLKPAALISGQVLVGFRRLNMLTRGLPDFNGVAASASVSMVFGGVNRLSISEQRDVSYSYDPAYPFYVLTGTSAQVQRKLGRSWDVVGRGALNHLGYRAATPQSGGNPSDRLVQYGAGFGYTVGTQLRVGLDANYYTRTSGSGVAAEFSGFRAGLSLSYGMPK